MGANCALNLRYDQWLPLTGKKKLAYRSQLFIFICSTNHVNIIGITEYRRVIIRLCAIVMPQDKLVFT